MTVGAMRILITVVLMVAACNGQQQPGNEGRPFAFQSFGSNQPSPPQSFQRINFFGPLQQQQQQQSPAGNDQLFFSSNSQQSPRQGQQEVRNPFFIPPGPQGPQDPRAGQRNQDFGPSVSASIQQTPANTGIFRQQDSSPKPLFQFQFGDSSAIRQQQAQQQSQRPFRPSVSADQADAPIRGQSSPPQLPALPVPLALRPRAPRPPLDQQRTEAAPASSQQGRVPVRVQPPEPATPIRAPPIQAPSDSQEAPSSSAERREPPAFQRVRPLAVPKEEAKPTTEATPPRQLQSLSEQQGRDDRQLRNRLRRPNSEGSTSAETTRRLPSTRFSSTESSSESSSEVPTTSPPSAGRGRNRVTLSSAEAEALTTSRPRATFFRGRTTVQPTVQTTSTEVLEASTEEPPSTTRRNLFGGRRQQQQQRVQVNSAEVQPTSSERPRVFHSNASVLRLKNNGNFRLRGRGNSEETSSELPTVQTSSERVTEEPSPAPPPPASANAVDGPASDRPEDETSPGEEEEDDVNGEEEDEEYEDDNDATPEAEDQPSSTTETAVSSTTQLTTTLLSTTITSTTTTMPNPVEESSKSAEIGETSPEPATTASTTTTTAQLDEHSSAKPQEEAAGQQQAEAAPTAPEANEDADQRRPAKLEIFNLGQSNTTSVNLDNVVFVPNLLGLQVQQRTSSAPTSTSTTLSPAAETSRSVELVRTPADEQSIPSDAQTDRQSKAIDANKADNKNAISAKQPVKDESLVDVVSIEEKSPAETSESSIDELDRLQSGLFNKHLTNLTNNLNTDSDKASKTTSTTTPTSEAPIVTSRAPFRPSFERPRHPFDILNRPPATTTTSTSTEQTSTSESTTATPLETTTLSLFERLFANKLVIKDDMSALLPPGFKEPEGPPSSTTEATTTSTTTTTTEASKPFDKLFGSLSVKFDDVSSLLPPGFKMPEPEVDAESSTTTSSTTTTKPGLGSLFEAAVLDDISGLLPPGFKSPFTPGKSEDASGPTESTTASSSDETTTTKKTGLVFPTRASPARNVTTEKPRAKPTFSPIEIKTGWPVRATTEFTGWPSPPTPVPTAPVTSSTTRATTSRTTTTTTTTTTTPRVTTPGMCGELCRLAGTVRLTDGVEWVPELRDHNTREWYQLANAIENELDAAYQNGPLAPWYTTIEVEAFSRGSVLVDYYLTLNGTADLDTGEIRNYFHLSLQKEGDQFKLGNYTVDDKSTDFIVVPQSTFIGEKERVTTGGVSEWVIAVIVVGLASLIFVIAFGTTMMIRRRRQHKRKSVPLTEEMLNELNKNHMSGADNSSGDSFYDVGDAWDHRTAFPTKPIKPLPRPASVNAIRTHGTSGFANYHNYNNFGNHFGAAARPQLHDFWKSEWDSAHYYDHSNSSTAQRIKAVPRPATSYGRYPTYGRPRPDYDDDF